MLRRIRPSWSVVIGVSGTSFSISVIDSISMILTPTFSVTGDFNEGASPTAYHLPESGGEGDEVLFNRARLDKVHHGQ